VTDLRDPRVGDPRGEPRHELPRRHHAMRKSSARGLPPVRDAPLAQQLEPVEGERRLSTGAHEPLAPLVVLRGDANGTVDIEPIAGRREAALLVVEVRVGVGLRFRGACEESPSGEREDRAVKKSTTPVLPGTPRGTPRVVRGAASAGRAFFSVYCGCIGGTERVPHHGDRYPCPTRSIIAGRE